MAVTNQGYHFRDALGIPPLQLSPLNLPPGKNTTEYVFLRKFGSPPTFGAHRDQIPLIQRIFDLCMMVFKLFVFAIQPNLFALGLVCGVVWDETCYAAIEKIKAVFFQQSMLGKGLLVAGAVIAGPAVLITGCFLLAASLGGQYQQSLRVD